MAKMLHFPSPSEYIPWDVLTTGLSSLVHAGEHTQVWSQTPSETLCRLWGYKVSQMWASVAKTLLLSLLFRLSSSFQGTRD